MVSAASGSDVPYEGDTDPTAILETRLRDLEAEVADLTAAADADVVAYLGMDILPKYRLRNEDRERYDDLMHRAGPIMAVRGKLGDAKTAAMNAALAARHTVEEAPAPMVVETPDLEPAPSVQQVEEDEPITFVEELVSLYNERYFMILTTSLTTTGMA